jgi:hypothetical protein
LKFECIFKVIKSQAEAECQIMAANPQTLNPLILKDLIDNLQALTLSIVQTYGHELEGNTSGIPLGFK